jgi:hypothetical protein
MHRVVRGAVVLVSLLAAGSVAWAEPVTLQEVTFNIDGVLYSSVPGGGSVLLQPGVNGPIDLSGFDLATGIGQIEVRLTGAGAHEVVAFLDVDLGALNDDDQGDVLGSPAPGQDWEMDDPNNGDIRAHVPINALDEVNSVADPANVAFAVAWTFDLGIDTLATLAFRVSPFDEGGFALNQFDAEEDLEVYFGSRLQVSRVDVPEPAIGWLAAAALVSSAHRLWRRRS